MLACRAATWLRLASYPRRTRLIPRRAATRRSQAELGRQTVDITTANKVASHVAVQELSRRNDVRTGEPSVLNIPVIRWGKPYDSLEKDEIVHFFTGEPIAQLSQANGGLVQRDMRWAAGPPDAREDSHAAS